MSGLLTNGAPRLQKFNLSERLVVDGAYQTAKRVEVLDFTAGAERFIGVVHRHVGVDAHRSFFHSTVRGPGGDQDSPQLTGVGARLRRGANIGTRDDLNEWHARAVVVNQRTIGAVNATASAEVRRLAGVLF